MPLVRFLSMGIKKISKVWGKETFAEKQHNLNKNKLHIIAVKNIRYVLFLSRFGFTLWNYGSCCGMSIVNGSKLCQENGFKISIKSGGEERRPLYTNMAQHNKNKNFISFFPCLG